MFVREMRCCSVVTVIVDVFVVCLHVVFWSSGFYHLKAASEADTGGSGPRATRRVQGSVGLFILLCH